MTSVLSENDQKERLSFSYACAIAARAGFSVAVSDLDRDSVDMTISAGGEMRPRIDIQLKATHGLRSVKNTYAISLPNKNYNDLRAVTQTPRILVVLNLPKEQEKWLSVSIKQLVIKKAAFWVSLKGAPATATGATTTVHLPKVQIFDADALASLIDRSRTGSI